jgi:hypothetical protein
MNSTQPETAAPATEPTGQPARQRFAHYDRLVARRRRDRDHGLRRRLSDLSRQALPRLDVADPIERVRDIRDDLQTHITALLRDPNI